MPWGSLTGSDTADQTLRKNAGETEKLRQQWLNKLTEDIRRGRHLFHRKKAYQEITEALEQAGFLHDRSFQELLAEKKDILSDYYNIGDGWFILLAVLSAMWVDGAY